MISASGPKITLWKKAKVQGFTMVALHADTFAESVTKAPLQWQGGQGPGRDQAEILQFPAALPPLLTGTLYTNLSNSYLISLFLKWSRFKPSLSGRFTEENVRCTWKAKRLGFISLGLQHCFLELVQLKWKGKYSQLWWYLFHTWLFWNVSQVLLQFPVQKSLSKGNSEEIPQSNTLLSS